MSKVNSLKQKKERIYELPQGNLKLKPDNEKQIRSRRTRYAITPDKNNLVEIQRKVNKLRLSHPKIPVHIEELHQLDKKRKQTREKLIRARTAEMENETYSFKPEISRASKKLMTNSNVDLIKRNLDWLRQKDEKIQQLRQAKEKDEKTKEYDSMTPKKEFSKSKIDVRSKVKDFLDQISNNAQKLRSTDNAKGYSSMSPVTPTKGYSSYLLNSKLKRHSIIEY